MLGPKLPCGARGDRLHLQDRWVPPVPIKAVEAKTFGEALRGDLVGTWEDPPCSRSRREARCLGRSAQSQEARTRQGRKRCVLMNQTSEEVAMVVDALGAFEYWELGDRLPRNNGDVFHSRRSAAGRRPVLGPSEPGEGHPASDQSIPTCRALASVAPLLGHVRLTRPACARIHTFTAARCRAPCQASRSGDATAGNRINHRVVVHAVGVPPDGRVRRTPRTFSHTWRRPAGLLSL